MPLCSYRHINGKSIQSDAALSWKPMHIALTNTFLRDWDVCFVTYQLSRTSQSRRWLRKRSSSVNDIPKCAGPFYAGSIVSGRCR